MSVAVKITFDDAAVRAAFARLKAAAIDPAPALDEIGAAMVSKTQERFVSGVGPGGVPWPPSIRARMGKGQTLIGSPGRLIDSFSHHFDRQSVSWGTNVIYAKVHQFGATIRARAGGFLTFFIPGVGWRRKREVTIPPRPFLGVDAEDRVEILAILRDHLARAAAPGSGSGAGPGSGSGAGSGARP